MNLSEVMRQRQLGLRVDDIVERVSVDERIAIAITADPHADFQERGQLRQCSVMRFERGQGVASEARYFGQKARAEIVERIVDFIANAQLGQAQHRGLPELQNHAMQMRFTVILVERQRFRNCTLGIEGALSFNLSGMRSQRRTDGRAP